MYSLDLWQQARYSVAELDKGLIYALSARDGRLLWHASLLPPTARCNGQAAMQAPVVDEHTDHWHVTP
jgi:hypothetical protein